MTIGYFMLYFAFPVTMGGLTLTAIACGIVELIEQKGTKQ